MSNSMGKRLARQTGFELAILPYEYAVCKLGGDDEIPDWADQGGLMAIIRTDELTVVCRRAWIPDGILMEAGWRAFRVVGTLDFSLVGVLAALTAALADAGVSVYAISTYETDILLVKEVLLGRAVSALQAAGHRIVGQGRRHRYG